MAKTNKNIELSLKLSNVGPLYDCSFNYKVGSLQIGMYADNGSGKTFLSRMFELTNCDFADYEVDTSNSYITKGENDLSFEFDIKNTNDTIKQNRNLKVRIRRSYNPIVTDGTDYIFHVFNSDYVDKNLRGTSYSPNGDIQGFILGKSNIDVSEEKKQLANLITQRGEKSGIINAAIEKGKSDLLSLGVRSNTSELRQFNFDNLLQKQPVDVSYSVSEAKTIYERIKNFPENIDDLGVIESNFELGFLNDIGTAVENEYTRSSLSEDFKEKLKGRINFIEEGMKYREGNICPFCNQKLEQNAIELINKYEEYLSDEEAKVIKKLNQQIFDVLTIKDFIGKLSKTCLDRITKYSYIAAFFPTLENSNIGAVNTEAELFDIVDELKNIIDEKIENISKRFTKQNEIIKKINLEFSKINSLISDNNSKISILNRMKSEITQQQLNIKRMLCNATFNEVLHNCESDINTYIKYGESIETLIAEIEEKESKVKQSKRDKVAHSFTSFIDIFFKDKYKFDKDAFSIVFNDSVIGKDAVKILSDGEKNIIAFCYYLSETHAKINREAEYNKIMFIVDDPISSLDFHYVYAVSEIIRKIGIYFGVERSKVIVLTHNIEFMNILIKNKITKENYIINRNKISKLNECILLPYENHLLDIFKISAEKELPNHHTPNSIRHILETISNFETPNSRLNTYFNKNEDLKKNEFLYSLINDCSHGYLRNQKPYTDEMIIGGCKVLINHITVKYKGQLEKIKQVL